MSRPIVNIRASSMSSLADCGHRWYTENILGKRTPSSGKALLGSGTHRGTAAYDASMLNGSPITLDEAVGVANDHVMDPGYDVLLDEDDKRGDIARISGDLTKLYIEQIAPRYRFVAVEIKCDGLVIEDLGLSLSGSVDRIYESNNGYGVADVKTGGAAVKADGTVETKGHAFQAGTYELLAEHASELPVVEGSLIFGLQAGKTAKGQRAAVSEPIIGARELLVGDGETPGVLELFARTIHSGSFIGNPRSMFCHSKYCAAYHNCPFRK